MYQVAGTEIPVFGVLVGRIGYPDNSAREAWFRGAVSTRRAFTFASAINPAQINARRRLLLDTRHSAGNFIARQG
jgi:hypothetical protein